MKKYTLCGECGHTARKCPQKRNRAVIVRVGQMTLDEQDAFVTGVKKLKRAVAPDARAALIEGFQHQLSSQPIQQLPDEEENE